MVVAAIVACSASEVTALFAYDRAAIARGEGWRLLTAHLTHFSAPHLLNNLAVLAPAAWLVESRRRSDAAVLYVVAALAISSVLWVDDPALVEFRGASGIAVAFLVYAALLGLREAGSWRVVCTILLAAVAVKLIGENCWTWQVFDWETKSGFVPVWKSHLIGACSGVGMCLWHIGRRHILVQP